MEVSERHMDNLKHEIRMCKRELKEFHQALLEEIEALETTKDVKAVTGEISKITKNIDSTGKAICNISYRLEEIENIKHINKKIMDLSF